MKPIPTEFQHPPDDDPTVVDKPLYGPFKEATLTLNRKEGHYILELARGPGPQNMIWTQCAGCEVEDALQKAKTVWKFSECTLVSQTADKEVWAVKFTD